MAAYIPQRKRIVCCCCEPRICVTVAVSLLLLDGILAFAGFSNNGSIVYGVSDEKRRPL